MTFVTSFEIEAIVIIGLVILYSIIRFSSRAAGNKKFIIFTIILEIAATLDLVTALIFMYWPSCPVRLNQFLNTIYFSSASASSYAFYSYVDFFMVSRPEKSHKRNRNLNLWLLLGTVVFFIVNNFTGILFYFDENGVYHHAPLFFLVYLTVVYYIFNIFIFVLIYRKDFTPLQKLSIFAFEVFEIVASLLQAVFFENVLLIYMAAAFGVLMLVFTLETPDYLQLKKTMEELQKAREEADAVSEAKGVFLFNMSNEIKAPLDNVIEKSQLILSKAGESQIKDYSAEIQESTQNILSIVGDVLTIAEIESGKTEIVKDKYNLVNLLADCYRTVIAEADAKGISLVFENDESVPKYLYGDGDKIKKSITNILLNAVRYTKKGSVNIYISGECGPEGDFELVISVSDTGIGIREDDFKRIFEPFIRVDKEKNVGIAGNGMGLRISDQLISKMGGKIDVNSVYGSGSTFVVRIPQELVDSQKMGNFWDCFVAGDNEKDIKEVVLVDNGKIISH